MHIVNPVGECLDVAKREIGLQLDRTTRTSTHNKMGLYVGPIPQHLEDPDSIHSTTSPGEPHNKTIHHDLHTPHTRRNQSTLEAQTYSESEGGVTCPTVVTRSWTIWQAIV